MQSSETYKKRYFANVAHLWSSMALMEGCWANSYTGDKWNEEKICSCFSLVLIQSPI